MFWGTLPGFVHLHLHLLFCISRGGGALETCTYRRFRKSSCLLLDSYLYLLSYGNWETRGNGPKRGNLDVQPFAYLLESLEHMCAFLALDG